MWIGTVLAAGLALPAPPPAAAPVQSAALERLHALAGEWSLVDVEGEASGLRARYEVSAAGMAVVETLFPGTPEETLTIYHQGDSRLAALQLSARGDAVRFGQAPAHDAQEIVFESPADDERPEQVAGLRLVLEGEGRARLEWSLRVGAELVPLRRFDLRREVSLADLTRELGRARASLDSLQRELDRRLKDAVEVRAADVKPVVLLETRTLPGDDGWDVSGVPLRRLLHEGTVEFASTYAGEGDRGLTIAHLGFVAGPDCRVSFSVLGGHGYVCLVEEQKTPPRRIRSIPDFSVELLGGGYGTVVERIVGERWAEHAVAIEWDLSRFEGESMRLYVVDPATDKWGQIGASTFRITQRAPEKR